jgi:hypothetical protein
MNLPSFFLFVFLLVPLAARRTEEEELQREKTLPLVTRGRCAVPKLEKGYELREEHDDRQ